VRRKVTLSIAAVLIMFDIGFTAMAVDAGERRVTAGVAAIAALVRDYIRPIPKLDGFL
jgi:hypothetical protein